MISSVVPGRYPLTDLSSNTSLTQEATDKDAETFRRYCQFFKTKFLHILVQSRNGDRLFTFGYRFPVPASAIGLRIDEIGEVCAYLRLNFPSYPILPNKLNVDFILHTADGYDLPLESWRMEVNYTDEPEKVPTHTLLCMDVSTLLKSVITAARMTPAFRYYVSSQSESTYVVTYRIYEGIPEINLGPGSKTFQVGMVRRKHGSIVVNLHYRTKMEYERSMRSSVRQIDYSVLHSRNTTHSSPEMTQMPHTWKSESAIETAIQTMNESNLRKRPRSRTSGCLKRKLSPMVDRCPFAALLECSRSEPLSVVDHQSRDTSTKHTCAMRRRSSGMIHFVTPTSENTKVARVHGLSNDMEGKENEMELEKSNSDSMLSDNWLRKKYPSSEDRSDICAFIRLCSQASDENIQFPVNCSESLMKELDQFKMMEHEFDRFVEEVTAPEETD